MKIFIKIKVIVAILVFSSCTDKLNELELNNNFAGGTDFAKTEDMILSILSINWVLNFALLFSLLFFLSPRATD